MHTVEVDVLRGQIVLQPCCVHAKRGDLIVWHLGGSRPCAVIVKAFEGPLDWGYKVTRSGDKWMHAWVREDAKPGFYPYALVTVEGGRLLVADPEIIVPPPKGGR